jgi:hypothetical protein
MRLSYRPDIDGLALVLVATMLLGSVLLLVVAGEQQALAKSALAATLSVSNVWFWSVSNYFTVALAVARARSRQRPRRA